MSLNNHVPPTCIILTPPYDYNNAREPKIAEQHTPCFFCTKHISNHIIIYLANRPILPHYISCLNKNMTYMTNLSKILYCKSLSPVNFNASFVLLARIRTKYSCITKESVIQQCSQGQHPILNEDWRTFTHKVAEVATIPLKSIGKGCSRYTRLPHLHRVRRGARSLRDLICAVLPYTLCKRMFSRLEPMTLRSQRWPSYQFL